MEITEVKVFPIDEEKLKAFVSVVFDGCFMVNDIKVIRGKDGLFISMPSRKKKNGEFKDVAHPLNNETRRRIEARILSEYEIALSEQLGEAAPAREVRPRPLPADRSRGADPAATVPESQPAQAPVLPRSNGHGKVEPSPVIALEDEEKSETPPGEKTLEEVEEMHLRDSFWSVT